LNSRFEYIDFLDRLDFLVFLADTEVCDARLRVVDDGINRCTT
jgi:hypothetical protein